MLTWIYFAIFGMIYNLVALVFARRKLFFIVLLFALASSLVWVLAAGNGR